MELGARRSMFAIKSFVGIADAVDKVGLCDRFTCSQGRRVAVVSGGVREVTVDSLSV